MGSDQNLLSLEALKNIYELAATKLKEAKQNLDSTLPISPQKLKTEDSVLIKDHTAGCLIQHMWVTTGGSRLSQIFGSMKISPAY